jgi:hypothetical protein
MRLDKTRMSQSRLERSKDRIKTFDVANLKNQSLARGKFRQLARVLGILSNGFFHQQMFAANQKLLRQFVMCVRRRGNRCRVDQLGEFRQRFRRHRAMFSSYVLPARKINIIDRGEFRRRKLSVKSCMIAPDVPNANNSDA